MHRLPIFLSALAIFGDIGLASVMDYMLNTIADTIHDIIYVIAFQDSGMYSECWLLRRAYGDRYEEPITMNYFWMLVQPIRK